MKVGLIVERHHGTYYCSSEVGRIPKGSPGAEIVFVLDENVGSPQELFQKARDEANRRGIGEVVNLPV